MTASNEPSNQPAPAQPASTAVAALKSGSPAETAMNSRTTGRDSRRAFLFKVSLVLNGAVGAVLAVPIIGYILGPALKRDKDYKSWIALGPVDSFPAGETRLVDFRNPVTTDSDGATGNVPCWVRRVQGNKFQVFAINCAHLGCPVRWFPQSHLFMCPCHGGVYYADGSRASGPPERGLFEYAYSIVNNNLMIDAGQMPTLSNQACNQEPLIQIAPNASARDKEGRLWPA
ncbi:MAG TPA: Rieske 2Fe-2S domain-containing protein [Terracidiphilus sp.]|nr:Rieske 2Fe-2S domain-containing protein [Terracidiphilus sp.]